MEPDRPDSTLGTALAATLRKDRVAQLGLAASAVTASLCLGPQSMWEIYLPLGLIGTLVVILQWRLRRLPTRGEVRFWSEVTAAYGCWLAADLIRWIVPDVSRASPIGHLRSGLFAAFYVLLVFAVERRPHYQDPPTAPGLERMLTLPAVAVFVVGLSFYLVVAPLLVAPLAPDARQSALLFYLILDGLLAGRILYMAATARTRRWRSLYAVLGVACGDLFLADLIEALDQPGGANLIPVYTTLWCLHFIIVMVAARLRHRPFPVESERSPEAERVEERFLKLSIKTATAALSFPLIHILFHTAHLLDPVNEQVRENLVVGWMLLLGTLGLLQHRLMDRKAHALWRERIRFEQALNRSEQDLRLIVERRKADQARQASEEKFARVFQSVPAVMAITRLADGRFLETSHAFDEMSGYRRDEILAHTSTELAFWADPKDREIMVARLRAQGSIHNFETEVRKKSGEKRRVLLSAEVITIDDEPCIISSVHDVGDRQVAHDRGKATAALLDGARDAVCVLDPEDRIAYWNRGAERLCGWPAAEVLGKAAAEVLFPPASAAAARQSVGENGEWIGELELSTQGGEAVRVASWWTRVGEQGGPEWVLILSSEVGS